MIIKTHTAQKFKTQLCCVNGDRVGLSSRMLLQFVSSGNVIGIILVMSVALALATNGAYGVPADLMTRLVMWPLQLMSPIIVGLVIIAALEYTTKDSEHDYVVVTMGVHLIALLITLPIGHVVMHGHFHPLTILKCYEMHIMISYFVVGMTFEYTLLKAATHGILVARLDREEGTEYVAPKFKNSGTRCLLRMVGLRKADPADECASNRTA